MGCENSIRFDLKDTKYLYEGVDWLRLTKYGDDEAERTSETSVDIQLRTRQYIPEDSELPARRRENLN
jgi:hypothetical protein